jgi:hypothetical protein
MAYAFDHPPQHGHWWRRHQVTSAGDVQVRVRPLGASGVALLAALVAAWGGISVFVGPLFDFRPTSVSAWQWTTQNWLLHLVPGAVGLVAGLMMLGRAAEASVGHRSRLMLAGLMALAAGAWFVIGPALWPTIESGPAYARAASAGDGFVNALGANLGPGLLLAFLAGMALKAAIAVPRVRFDPIDAEPAASGVDLAAGSRHSRATEEPAMAERPSGDRVRPVSDADVIERDRTGSGTPERPA